MAHEKRGRSPLPLQAVARIQNVTELLQPYIHEVRLPTDLDDWKHARHCRATLGRPATLVLSPQVKPLLNVFRNRHTEDWKRIRAASDRSAAVLAGSSPHARRQGGDASARPPDVIWSSKPRRAATSPRRPRRDSSATRSRILSVWEEVLALRRMVAYGSLQTTVPIIVYVEPTILDLFRWICDTLAGEWNRLVSSTQGGRPSRSWMNRRIRRNCRMSTGPDSSRSSRTAGPPSMTLACDRLTQ